MTKNLNQIIIFFLHQNQNIFFSNIGNQNIFLEKNHNIPPPLPNRICILYNTAITEYFNILLPGHVPQEAAHNIFSVGSLHTLGSLQWTSGLSIHVAFVVIGAEA